MFKNTVFSKFDHTFLIKIFHPEDYMVIKRRDEQIVNLDMRYLTNDLLYDQHLLAACQIILASLLMEKREQQREFLISNSLCSIFALRELHSYTL